MVRNFLNCVYGWYRNLVLRVKKSGLRIVLGFIFLFVKGGRDGGEKYL